MWKGSGGQPSLCRLSCAVSFPATGTSLQTWDESQLWRLNSFQIWLGVTFLTVTYQSPYYQSSRPDYIWGRWPNGRSCQLFFSLTLMLVFLPGAQLYSFRSRWVKEKWIWRWRLACLFFPITLVCFKVGWPRANISSFFVFSSGYPVATSESSNGWDEHQGDGLWRHLGITLTTLLAAFHHLLEVRHFIPPGGLVHIWKEVLMIDNVTKDCSHFDILVHGVFGCNWRFHPVRDEQGEGEK